MVVDIKAMRRKGLGAALSIDPKASIQDGIFISIALLVDDFMLSFQIQSDPAFFLSRRHPPCLVALCSSVVRW